MLQNTTKDLISQAAGSFAVSTVDEFVKQFVNHRYTEITAELRNYTVQPEPMTAVTEAGEPYYHKPPDTGQFQAMTIEVGGVKYNLTPVHSQSEWNDLNEIDFSGTTIPQYFFERRYDFGVYPTPQADGYTITANSNLQPAEMIEDDYVTGDITVTKDAQAIIGANGAVFDNTFVTRFFRADGDSRWYKIAAFVANDELTLQTYYEGLSQSNITYVIGQSPEVPEELHKYIPFGAAADFYALRKDFTAAQSMENYFYTGDFNNSSRKPSMARGGVIAAVSRYSTRGNTSIVSRRKATVSRFDERWSTTLSSTI